MNTLTVTIQREWLARILDGSKKIEYRSASTFWLTRLGNAGPPPFQLRLINGMSPDAPEATVLVEKVDIDLLSGQIRLHLGEVLAVVRWDARWNTQYPPSEPQPPLDLQAVLASSPQESDMVFEVSEEVFSQLSRNQPVPFSLPIEEDTYTQINEAPAGWFTVRVRCGAHTRKVVLLGAYDRYFEGWMDYVVLGM